MFGINEADVIVALLNIARALLILALTLLVARFSKALLLRMAKRGRISVNLAALLGNLATIAVVLLGAVFILPIFGVDWTGLLTLVGAIGIAISLALQDVLRNFVAGIYLLIERPFKIGDVIKVKEDEGVVQSIELRTTLLRTEDGAQVIVPNATVFTEVVTNQSAYNLQRQIVEVSTSTQTLEQMVEKVNAVLRQFDAVATNPSPETTVVSIEGGRLRLRVVYWTKPGSTVASQIAVALQGESPTIEIKLPS
jgi:small conductance mechanosensitive channel